MVIAPPGYGKTLVLAELAARDRRPVAWLSIDDFDNDPSVFLTYVAAALDRVQPIADETAASLSARGPRILASSVPRLAAELHRWPEPGTLILDDIHRLVDQGCLDALTALVDHLPPGFQIVLGGRAEPRLPLARFRAGRRLLEIGRGDLGLDADETAALAAAAGRALTGDRVAALTSRTEGWAAAVYLTLLAHPQAGGPASLDEGRPTSDDYIAEYVWSELLAGLPEPDLALLTRTSVIEVVEPGIADAVVGSTDAAARLEALSRTNGLVARIAGSSASYRCHPLLRDALGRELGRREPHARPELHRRAAERYASEGRAELAIEHALAGGDVDRAAELVAREALHAYYGGHADRLTRWLRSFDDDAFGRHPSLAVIAAMVSCLYGMVDWAERLADIAEHDGSNLVGAEAAAFESTRAMLRAVMARRGPGVMQDDAAAAAAAPAGSPWRYFALYVLAGAHLVQGEPELADAVLSDGIQAAVAADNSPYYGLAMRASLAIERHDWGAAESLARESHVAYDTTRLGDVVPAILTHAVSARVALRRGDFARGREELVHTQVARVTVSRVAPWTSVIALAETARAYIAIADLAGARSVVAEAEQILRHRPDLGILASRVADLRRSLDGAPLALDGPSTLTPAELRLLPILSTPLTFKEIGERLFLSHHTVKNEAISIYAKLEAASRSEAVERAIELGLLEPFPGLPARTRHSGG